MEFGIPVDSLATPREIAEEIRRAGGQPVSGSMDELAGDPPSFLVVEGDSGVMKAARAECASVLIPIEATPGIEPIDRDSLVPTIEALLTGAGERVSRSGVAASVGGTERARALFDLMLMTTEPATISEFHLRSDPHEIARYRADGVVISTPAGSGGYSRATGGAVIGPAVHALSVVPISPYLTAADHWVVDGGDLAIRITRDESSVALFTDDREIELIPSGTDVTFEPVRGVETVRLPHSRSPFDTGA